MNKIAFFDIDETLVRGQTQWFLAREAFRQKKISLGKLFALLIYFTRYSLGLVSDIREIMDKSHALLAGWPQTEAEKLMDDCFERRIKSRIYPAGVTLIKKLKAEGYKIFLISNTLQPIVDLLADELEADYGIGAELTVKNGILQGKVGRLVYGQGKVDYLRAHLGPQFDFSVCRVYTDNKSDLPLLELVGQPTVTNPDNTLRHIALKRKWPIVNF